MTECDRLFVYGTLQVDAVFERVAGRRLPARSAMLADHARYRVRGARYPGMVREVGARTSGRVYEGISAAMFESLDAYEGEAYERVMVEVVLDVEGEATRAWTYRTRPAYVDQLSAEGWELGRFDGRRYLAEVDAELS